LKDFGRPLKEACFTAWNGNGLPDISFGRNIVNISERIFWYIGGVVYLCALNLQPDKTI